MLLNSMQREEPYLGLTVRRQAVKAALPSGRLKQMLHGCRQLVP